MTNEVMTIRQMCDAYDVTPRTLRFYEAKELLFPIREGQRRLFTSRDRARLKLILRGKRFGFALEQIRQLLELYSEEDAGQRQLIGTLSAYKTRKTELEHQVEDLQQVLAELDEQMAWMQNTLDNTRIREEAE
ncbi:MerR family transcriptional regulator [Pacificibacter marinus]|uniref:MerR family transcriptional regulator n=1 Tax=Pacificibacter marinus TaxID=658057 RepID=UPI001C07C6CA|nr:MerR family DNA-binding transcriptional regulator [Pacificibacter marinus]MBU2868334.1 MerR family DNA-binding transcriptional regulator [Pacificibacter marinus]